MKTDDKKPIMVIHTEVEGTWNDGKYTSVVTETVMTMDESVAITITKF